MSADDPVEELMTRCLARPVEEWPAALDEAAHQHPECADELRARVRLLAGLDDVVPVDDSDVPSRTNTFPLRDFGDYRDLVPIGRGGMGIVYRASQISLGRDVAIKVIRPERVLYAGAVERFRREVETVASLRSPHVVSIHAVGETTQGEARLPWFSMELLEGATLTDVLSSLAGRAPESLDGSDLFHAVRRGDESELPEAFAGTWTRVCVRVARDIARALVHAHGRGVLHRDVKPGNVMVEPSGRTVLFDFGLTATRSSERERLTESGHPVGTLVYMPPEVLDDASAATERSDVYSLGITLYELLALQPPYNAESPIALSRAIDAAALPALRARNPEVSFDLQVVCAKAIARRPRDRYGSAAALADDLERLLDGRPITARPLGPLGRTVRWARRRPAAAVATSLAGVLMLGGPTALYALEAHHANELAAQARAEKRAKDDAIEANRDLEDVLQFTLGLFSQASPERHGGDIPDALEMLHLGAASLGELQARPASRARIELSLARLFSMLTDPSAAQRHIDVAVAHYRDATDRSGRARYAESLRLAAHNATFLSPVGRSVELAERAFDVAESLYSDNLPRLVEFEATRADTYGLCDRWEDAIAARRRVLGWVEGALEDDSRLAAQGLLGVALRAAERIEEARPLLEGAVAGLEGLDDAPAGRVEQFQLELSTLERMHGDPGRALELSQSAHDRLLTTHGPDSLLTLQARFGLARCRGLLGDYAQADADADAAIRGLAKRLAPEHPILLRAQAFRVGALHAQGKNVEIIDFVRGNDLLGRIEGTLGRSSDELRKTCTSFAISCQVRGEIADATDAFRRLVVAEREHDAFAGGHVAALLMFVGHRATHEGAEPLADEIALLREAIRAIGDEPLAVPSLVDEQVYEGGYMARVFLSGLLSRSAETAPQAQRLREEAEARRSRLAAGE